MPRKSFATLLSDTRLQKARDHFAAACEASRAHQTELAAALAAYGDHGSYVSGIGRAHFPDDVKTRLRLLASSVTMWSERAYAARPRATHFATMRKLSTAVALRDGSGFYGPSAR